MSRKKKETERGGWERERKKKTDPTKWLKPAEKRRWPTRVHLQSDQLGSASPQYGEP